MILTDISVDTDDKDMASKTLIHLITYGYTSELVIDSVPAMQVDFTSDKSPSNSVNIPCTFASIK